jgi:nucleotide-binding universal stress UspA family protein
MKKLLVPVDFSDTSEAAVDFGLQLAKMKNAELMLLHSVDFSGTYESMYLDGPHVQSFTDEVIKEMELKMQNLYSRIKEEGLNISTHLTSGSFLQDIRDFVEENDVDLIVMGTKGASGIKEFFVGSNTEKIVRFVDCPVISVPHRVDLGSIRKLLLPVDLGELRPSFFEEVARFQELFSASVEFVWVKTPHQIENLKLINEEFDNLLSEYKVASSSFTIIRDVLPQDGILNHACETGADMLAMATHSRRGLAHWFTGSMTEDVMNHAKIPLWSLKIIDHEEPINLESFQKLRVAE